VADFAAVPELIACAVLASDITSLRCLCVILWTNLRRSISTRRYLNVSNNELEGELPTLPTGLVSMDISSNKISGSLPADMSAYASLVDIQGYYNALEGELPHKLPPNMIQMALTGNRFTGNMPALPRGLKYLSLAENALQGPLPNGPGAAQLWFVSGSLGNSRGLARCTA